MITKKLHFSYFILSFLSYLFFASCSSTSTTSLPVLKPADITLPDHIQKVAVVNRSLPDDKNKAWNIIEGIFTGEGIHADKIGSQYCIEGFSQTIMQSPRFQLVNSPVTQLHATGTGQMPPPLSWLQVESICQQSGADALILLEVFDSDAIITTEVFEKTIKNKEGAHTKVPMYRANMRMVVKSAWRIYDPSTKRTWDEVRGDDYMMFTAEGNNPQAAINMLIARREAINRTGRYAGGLYANRISPMWITVTRQYYKKGNDAMEMAARKARTNDWKGASEIWKKEANNADAKIAGRANYNMAVFCEKEGRLDLALEWARKSYTQYNNKKARAYTSILNQRMNQDARANEQMRSVNGNSEE
jgi:hypothetical protein